MLFLHLNKISQFLKRVKRRQTRQDDGDGDDGDEGDAAAAGAGGQFGAFGQVFGTLAASNQALTALLPQVLPGFITTLTQVKIYLLKTFSFQIYLTSLHHLT